MSRAWACSKLQTLTQLLKSPACIVLMACLAAAASFLSTGLLWPTAAILSSLITMYVQNHLDKQSQQRHPPATHGTLVVGTPHEEDTTVPQAEKCTGEPSSGEGKQTPVSEVVKLKACDPIGETQSATSIIKTELPTNLDHVEFSLIRSEGEDWGFAWQVGAYGAKRLIISNISTASPIDLCNTSRLAQGLPTIVVGDELIRIGSHSNFDMLQETLASAISVQLTFLRARAVPPVATSALRQKKRLVMERKNAAFEDPAQGHVRGKSKETSKDKDRSFEPASRPITDPAKASGDSFDMVVNTKNTFIELRLTENDHIDRFARSDPTPMLSMRQHLSKEMEPVHEVEAALSTRPNHSDEMQRVDESETPHVESGRDDGSVIEEEGGMSSLELPHYDTMDIQDEVNALKLKAEKQEHNATPLNEISEGSNTGERERRTSSSRNTMDLHDFLSEERSRCQEIVKENKAFSSEPPPVDKDSTAELLNLDTMDIRDFVLSKPLEESKNPICIADALRTEPLRVETSLLKTHTDFFMDGARETALSSTKEALAFDFQHRFANLEAAQARSAQTSQLSPTHSDPLASPLCAAKGSLDFSLGARSYANSFVDSPTRIQRPGSEILGTRPCPTTTWNVPSESASRFSTSMHQQLASNYAASSQSEASLKGRIPHHDTSMQPSTQPTIAECFYIPPSSGTPVSGTSPSPNLQQIVNTNVGSNDTAIINGSCTDTHVPRLELAAALFDEGCDMDTDLRRATLASFRLEENEDHVASIQLVENRKEASPVEEDTGMPIIGSKERLGPSEQIAPLERDTAMPTIGSKETLGPSEQIESLEEETAMPTIGSKGRLEPSEHIAPLEEDTAMPTIPSKERLEPSEQIATRVDVSPHPDCWRPTLRPSKDEVTASPVGAMNFGPDPAHGFGTQPCYGVTPKKLGEETKTACGFSNIAEDVESSLIPVGLGAIAKDISSSSNKAIREAGNEALRYAQSGSAVGSSESMTRDRRDLPKPTASGSKQELSKMSEDWYCPKCFDLQFKANIKCRVCGLSRDHGVTDVKYLDADKFLHGHRISEHAENQFRNLAPELQQAVMSGGSLHGARDATAVLSNRIRKARALASETNSPPNGATSQAREPVKLGFDRKRTRSSRQFPAGSAPR